MRSYLITILYSLRHLLRFRPAPALAALFLAFMLFGASGIGYAAANPHRVMVRASEKPQGAVIGSTPVGKEKEASVTFTKESKGKDPFAYFSVISEARADDPAPAPAEDDASIFMKLLNGAVSLYDVVKGKGSLAAILVLVFQLLKMVPGLSFIRKGTSTMQNIIVVLIGVGSSIVEAFVVDGNWLNAAFKGLVVSGGAILIYKAFQKKPA